MNLQKPLTLWQRLTVQDALMPGRTIESLPDGLAELICYTLEQTPATKTLFVFQDDLPDYERYWQLYLSGVGGIATAKDFRPLEFFNLQTKRQAALEQVLDQCVDEVNTSLANRGIIFGNKDALQATAAIASDAIFKRTHGLAANLNTSFFNVPDEPSIANICANSQYLGDYAGALMGQRPFLAVITLPAVRARVAEQHMLHITDLRDRISLDEAHPALLAVAGHEVGHLILHYNKKGEIPWTHEKYADTCKYSVLAERGHNRALDAEAGLRLVDGMANEISPSAAAYWNVLALMNNEDHSSRIWHRDVAAQLEVKQRAYAYLIGSEAVPVVPRYANRFVDSTFNAGAYLNIRREFKPHNMHSGRKEALLYALERVVADGHFTHTGSRELAEMTLTGAGSVAPKTFSSPFWAKYLRDKPNYLAP